MMLAQGRLPRIGFIVDHPRRDLPGLALVAAALAERGIESVLVPLYEQGMDVPLLGLDAVVLNYARPVNLPLARSYAAQGIAVYVLDTEGGVLSDKGHSTPATLAAAIRDGGWRDILSGYFFWGGVLHEAFADARALPPGQLHLTGCPRFDFYAPVLRDMDEPRRSGHILINTNYPLANPRFVANAAGDRAAVRAVGYDNAYIEQLFDDTARVMDNMIAAVGRLAGDFPGHQFVVRPHPFEADARYRTAFASLSNVAVDPEGPVFDALRGARALLHVNCGTAIEALMLDVPPLALEFANTDFLRAHASLPSRASLAVASYEDLHERLASSAPGEGFDFAGHYRAVAEPYFHRNDGAAAERVAAALAASLHDASASGPLPRASLARSLRGSHPRPSIAQRFQALFGNLLGSASTARLRARIQARRRGKAFSNVEVEAVLARLARHRGTTPLKVERARHPFTAAGLSSVLVRPGAAQGHPG